MKPKRSYRPIMQKIVMVTLVLSIIIVPSSLANKTESNEKEVSIVFEPNTKPLIINEEDNETTSVEVEEQEEVISEYDQLLIDNTELITFYANMFNIPVDIIQNDLKTRSMNEEIIDVNNLGFLKDENNNLKTHANIDLGLIEYYEEYLKLNPQHKNNQLTPYTGNSEYVKGLVAYFTNVFSDVDYNIAITIGAAESGHYTVKSMLSVNNVFGGMYKGKLIRYHNIEYGVYRYIKLLNNNYFGKGLTTFEAIGIIYCPVTINGVKQTNPHWLSLVNNITHKYEEHNINTIEDIVLLK